MKFALIGPTYPFRGGIAHYTTLLCRALRTQHDVLFISFRRQYPRWLFPGRNDRDLSQLPVRVEDVEYLLDSLNPFTWEAAYQKIAEFRPDIMVFPWWTAFWTLHFWYLARRIKQRCDAEIVAICHNVSDHESSWMKTLASKIVLTQADRFITHSHDVTAQLHGLLGNGISVITAFHPTYKDLSHQQYTKSQAKQRLGLSGHVLLFFGFVRAYKGLDILLEAMPSILNKKNVHLLIVGEFWRDKTKYLDQISRHKLKSSITIIDTYIPNEELGLYFEAADLVVQPYLRASGSGVCQLAFGFDRPVIATDVGSLPEVIQDGVNGRIVAPGDVAGLAKAILESLEPTELRKFSQHARHTKERFSWGKMVRIIAE